jgi:gamma-glutamylcyclotransferase (GGCT)/AIG2-like uncharacterized protein YtfP
MIEKVFVYGTLLNGERNHHHLNHDGIKLIGTDEVSGFKMYNLGSFPACVPSKYSKVFGEIYDCSEYPDRFKNKDGVLHSLDMLEGYPRFYNRKVITTLKGHECWIYFIDRSMSGRELIASGNWRTRND